MIKKLFIFLILILMSEISFAQDYGWTKLTSPANGNLRRIYVSGSEAWLDSGSNIYYSNNYPLVQFSSVYTSTNGLYDMTFINQNGSINGWAVGTSSLGTKTIDGTNWTSMSLGGTSSYYCVSFPETSLGFASGTDKRLHKTINGGVNWTDTGVILGFSTVNTLFFVDSNTGYVGTADPRLAKTTDGGATWTDEGDISGSINDFYFYDSAHGWAVGSSDILYNNNGIWTQINNTTRSIIKFSFFYKSKRRLDSWCWWNDSPLYRWRYELDSAIHRNICKPFRYFLHISHRWICSWHFWHHITLYAVNKCRRAI